MITKQASETPIPTPTPLKVMELPPRRQSSQKMILFAPPPILAHKKSAKLLRGDSSLQTGPETGQFGPKEVQELVSAELLSKIPESVSEAQVNFDGQITDIVLDICDFHSVELGNSLMKVLYTFDKYSALGGFKRRLVKLKRKIEVKLGARRRKVSSSDPKNAQKSKFGKIADFDSEDEIEAFEGYVEDIIKTLDLLYWSYFFDASILEEKGKLYLVVKNAIKQVSEVYGGDQEHEDASRQPPWSSQLKKRLFLCILDSEIELNSTEVASIEIYFHKKRESRKRSKIYQTKPELASGELQAPPNLSLANISPKVQKAKSINIGALNAHQSAQSPPKPSPDLTRVLPREFIKLKKALSTQKFYLKVEDTSPLTRPFKPLTYAETSNYLIEILFISDVLIRSEYKRKMMQKAMNLREAINQINAESQDYSTGNNLSKKKIQYSDVRALALKLCYRVKSNNMFSQNGAADEGEQYKGILHDNAGFGLDGVAGDSVSSAEEEEEKVGEGSG